MKNIKILGVDIGASGGKMGLAEFDGNKLDIKEYRDFENRPVHIGSAFYWDVFSLFNHIVDGMSYFNASYGEADTVAVDAWGATFGLLDNQGRLLQPVYHYRDLRTENSMDNIAKVIDMKTLFKMSGCQCNRTYTLPQMHAYVTEGNRYILENADRMLFLPDLLSYFLCGDKTCEMTIAGTSGLMENQQTKWNYETFEKFNIPSHIFPEIVTPGTIRGSLRDQIKSITGMSNTKFVATVEHDSAAAVAAIPGFGQHKLYISVGTNISMGVEKDNCILTDEAFEKGFKNTGGINMSKIVYRDFSASWHVNEFIRTRKEQGKNYSHPELINMAASIKSPRVFIDVEAPIFLDGVGDYCKKMDSYFESTGQRKLESDEERIRCIFESIALKVRHYAASFQEIGEGYNSVHIVNGATRNELLMQLISNALGMGVEAGMPYATINGNILTQLLAIGEVSNVSELREISRNSFEMKEYEPLAQDEWSEIVGLYQTVISS